MKRKTIKPTPTQRGRPRTSSQALGSLLTRSIGKSLHTLRTSKGFSMRELSGLSGVSTGMICDIENGLKAPTTDTLSKLSKALKVEMTFFLEGKK